MLLNPYVADLNLSDKDNKNLYQDARKGIHEECKFDGKKHKYNKFVKLIEKQFKRTRVMEALDIAVQW